jgi:hypothetical protein
VESGRGTLPEKERETESAEERGPVLLRPVKHIKVLNCYCAQSVFRACKFRHNLHCGEEAGQK